MAAARAPLLPAQSAAPKASYGASEEVSPAVAVPVSYTHLTLPTN